MATLLVNTGKATVTSYLIGGAPSQPKYIGWGTGAGTATVMSYGKVNTAGNTLATYGATVSGNIAQLQATTTNANTIFRIKRDYQAI